ncbi:protein CURVATURE THYLAKOID 1B, chloroplastic-like [Magnolia sinica]|uniref:protein CURVATURE THYLAKOID 1B, chloroplastic-like n=1 Tax=Magnolia sinica TaxID=86752 RepID=UPI00265A28D5|nr:protein CURVATURE THYLAKOID 1B, chloroplastic-like [Magnolia sinica]
MASTSATISLSSPSTLIDGKAPRQQHGPLHSITFHPSVGPTNRLQNRDARKTNTHCRGIARNVISMATGETQIIATGESPAEEESEIPEIMKTVQEVWDKIEDKYAVTVLALAVAIALWGSAGLISAIDRLPLVPAILELIGIGYTGWFVYRNLVFTPERETLINKIKDTYSNVIGSD